MEHYSLDSKRVCDFISGTYLEEFIAEVLIEYQGDEILKSEMEGSEG